MTIQQIRQNASYLYYCKDNYIKGIRPADERSVNTKGYEKLVDIAKLYFKSDLLSDFADYLYEDKYLVQLWTAHLILEHGQPDEMLRQRCLDEIKKYAGSTWALDVAMQEQKWLRVYFENE